MAGGRIVVGGEEDAATRFIAPTVLDDVDLSHPLMTDEIFGPLLPIVPFDDVQEAVQFINRREKPLALYIFSEDSKFCNTIIRNTSSGGVTVNDTLMHAAVDSLPFGGVGGSGMGAYHGKNGFDTFSHKKSVMRRKLALEFTNGIRYPPYTEQKKRWITLLMMKTAERSHFLWASVVVVIAAAAAIMVRVYVL
jgi:aldehyde dehydrogenase (NAD+)